MATSPRNAIMLSIAFLLGAILMPIGIGEVYGANTTGWGSAVITVFQTVFSILAVISLAIAFIPRGGK